MPATSIIRAAALTPRPWPNGLGVTRDVHAENRSAAGYDWLLSVADLVEDAAFSHFPTCDRIFTLIEGAGVTLTLDGDLAMPCQTLVPASFPGNRPTFCTLPHGPARAFNLFYDRAAFSAQVTALTLAASHTTHSSERSVAVYCVAGTLEIAAVTLQLGDTLIGPGAAPLRAGGAAAVAIIVEITHR